MMKKTSIQKRASITRKALVIGAGISGIQAALDVSQTGYQVTMVEKKSYIGGHMAQLAETFPTLDCAACILTPRTAQVSQTPLIKLYTHTEIEDISGSAGDFAVTIRKKARYIKEDKCTGCGICQEKCPQKKIPSEYDEGMGMRNAIYIAFPQAIPNFPVIDRQSCIFFKKGKCRICEKFCEVGAIDFEQQDEIIEEKFGAIIIATGYERLGRDHYSEYGYGTNEDVINSLQFERLLSAAGPTGGEIRRPSDDRVPKSIVFVSCVGSRDSKQHFPYCSKICCMYTAKHAILYKHRVQDGNATVFYIDVRAGGKGYEEFVHRAQVESKVRYIRGKVSKIFKEEDKLIVWAADTLDGKQVEVRCDMVVLAMAIVPGKQVSELLKKLKISADKSGFITEAHPRLNPLETKIPGIYLAGCAQGPKDIPETVAQASGAAGKVITLFSQEVLAGVR